MLLKSPILLESKSYDHNVDCRKLVDKGIRSHSRDVGGHAGGLDLGLHVLRLHGL